jgi:antitoxin component of MazEF toxin-antitoxin module
VKSSNREFGVVGPTIGRIDQRVEEAKLKEGDSLEIEAPAEGRVELRRPTKILTLSQLVSQITPENRYGEVSTGAEVGKEAVEW